jgi:hypothetical protein
MEAGTKRLSALLRGTAKGLVAVVRHWGFNLRARRPKV